MTPKANVPLMHRAKNTNKTFFIFLSFHFETPVQCTTAHYCAFAEVSHFFGLGVLTVKTPSIKKLHTHLHTHFYVHTHIHTHFLISLLPSNIFHICVHTSDAFINSPAPVNTTGTRQVSPAWQEGRSDRCRDQWINRKELVRRWIGLICKWKDNTCLKISGKLLPTGSRPPSPHRAPQHAVRTSFHHSYLIPPHPYDNHHSLAAINNYY